MIKANQRIFYVYGFLRSKDSRHGKKATLYYIGKGNGNRAFSCQRRGAPRPKDPSHIVFIQEGLTEAEALSLERYCIALYGRVNTGTGILRNLTDGGDGVTGIVFSKESRELMRRNNQGKKLSSETKRRISLANKGKTIPADVRKKIAATKECHVYELTSPLGVVYTCSNLREFARQHNLHTANLSAVARGKRNHHKNWKARIVSDGEVLGRKHTTESIEKIRKKKELFVYELLAPSGGIHITRNLSQFAKAHDLDQSALWAVVHGQRNHHKGWTGRIIETLK